MIKREKENEVRRLLSHHPAVGLIGPRQVGKTTLALEIGKTQASVYLDLESPADLAKISEPELYFSANEDKLIICNRSGPATVTRSLTPKPSKGFYFACGEVNPEKSFVVYPGSERFLLSKEVEAIGLMDLMSEFQN